MSTISNAICIDAAREDDASIISDIILVPVAPKIIHALRSYTPHNPQELGFSGGAFFYVVAEVKNRGGWYEACHPMSSARGLVPKSYFRAFLVSDILNVARAAAADALLERGRATIESTAADSSLEHPSPTKIVEYINSSEDNNQSSVATPLRDEPLRFTLDFANLQTPIDDEPFTFGDLSEIIARGELPTMEDWKRVARGTRQSEGSDSSDTESMSSLYSYDSEAEGSDFSGESTASSYSTHLEVENSTLDEVLVRYDIVPLSPVAPSEDQQIISGATTPTQSPPSSPRNDGTGPRTEHSHLETTSPVDIFQLEPQRTDSDLTTQTNSPPQTPTQTVPSHDRSSSLTYGRPNPNILPPGLLLSTKIVAVERHNEQDWFKIEGVYLPDGESSTTRTLVIFRLYGDFYDFQLALLNSFPIEAGRECGPHQTVRTRKLPLMPRPEPEEVGRNDTVNEQLVVALNDYLDQLCELVDIHAEHVLRHEVVRSFFAPWVHDEEAASHGQMELVASHNPELAENAPEVIPEGRRDTGDFIDVLAALSLGPNISRDGNSLRTRGNRHGTAYWTEILRREESSSELEDLRYLAILEEEGQWAEERRRREARTGQEHYLYSNGGSRHDEHGEPLQIDIEGIESPASLLHDSSISPSSSKRDGLCVVCQDELATMAVIDCGHLALCRLCSEKIMKTTQECPLCRAFILNEERLIRIFKT